MYGVNKVAGELLCQYYFKRFGVDTRSVRFPGLISHVKEPGGGTTDYAVEIYFKAVREGHYTSFIDKGTYMDMMYMDDAIEAIIKLMEADDAKLETRNGYNLSAMSFRSRDGKRSNSRILSQFYIRLRCCPLLDKVSLIVGRILLIQAVHVANGDSILNMI